MTELVGDLVIDFWIDKFPKLHLIVHLCQNRTVVEYLIVQNFFLHTLVTGKCYSSLIWQISHVDINEKT